MSIFENYTTSNGAFTTPSHLHQTQDKTNTTVVLVGLAAISRAVGAGPITVRKWIKEEKFPARRYTDGIYRADPEAIRRWFTENSSSASDK